MRRLLEQELHAELNSVTACDFCREYTSPDDGTPRGPRYELVCHKVWEEHLQAARDIESIFLIPFKGHGFLITDYTNDYTK